MNGTTLETIIKSATIVLFVAVGSLWVLFIAILIRPGLLRRVAQKLNRLLPRLVQPEYFVGDIFLWSRHAAGAMLNITKAFDWRVTQWSGFATALLAATLAFVSAVVVEYFKGTPLPNLGKVALLGVAASILVFVLSQRRIRLLKNQFLRIYSLLQWLAEED